MPSSTAEPAAPAGLVFGPLRYRCASPMPEFLSPCGGHVERDAPTLELSFDAPPPDARTIRGVGVRIRGDARVVYLSPERGWQRRLHAPLAELVARDLPSRGALLLHASAVRVADGVALIVGPPTVGKTTFARHAGDRAFAGNAVCAWAEAGRWRCAALPFASDPDPALDARGEAMVSAIVELRRGGPGSFEWLDPRRATVAVMRCVAVPSADDPWRRERAVLALDLSASVGVASLASTGQRTDLDLLDRSLAASSST